MRLFAAIDIEPAVRQRLANAQQQLKDQLNLSSRQVKWVDPSQVHLTLKFLGEVKDDQITKVCDTLRRTAAACSSFDFEVKGMGVFGRPARVVWAGITDCPPLYTLQKELEKEFEKLGWDREDRAFEGHLTICRVKNVSAGQPLSQAVSLYENEYFGPVTVSELVLYQSLLSSSGPAYTVVSKASLK